MSFYQLLMEDGSVLAFENGDTAMNDGYRIEDTDSLANNEFFTTQTQQGSSLNFVDWSESNPFGEI